MRQTPAALAMRRFVEAAIKAAGSQREVSELLADAGITEHDRPYSQTGISGWASGRTEKVPAEPLFELARRLKISMDQFALEDDQDDRMRRLEAQVSVMVDRLGELLDDRGLAPLEFPGA